MSTVYCILEVKTVSLVLNVYMEVSMINLTDVSYLTAFILHSYFNVNSLQEKRFHEFLAGAMCTFPSMVLMFSGASLSPDFKQFLRYFVFYMSPPLYFMSFHPKFEVNIFYKLSFSVQLHICVLIKTTINKPLFILWPLLVISKPVFLLFWTNT